MFTILLIKTLNQRSNTYEARS